MDIKITPDQACRLNSFPSQRGLLKGPLRCMHYLPIKPNTALNLIIAIPSVVTYLFSNPIQHLNTLILVMSDDECFFFFN